MVITRMLSQFADRGEEKICELFALLDDGSDQEVLSDKVTVNGVCARWTAVKDQVNERFGLHYYFLYG